MALGFNSPKKLNKRMLGRLYAFNRDLMAPADVMAALGLTAADAAFLAALAALPEGFHPLAGAAAPLAEKGLVFAKNGRVALADAGRFLLNLITEGD